jgi:VWFA-related protein
MPPDTEQALRRQYLPDVRHVLAFLVVRARFRPLVLALLMLTSGSAASMRVAQRTTADPTPASQVFRGGVDFVYVDAYPRRNHQLLRGLQARDFEVLEDGKPQTIESFEFVATPTGGAVDRRDPRSDDEAQRWIADPKNRVFIVYLDLYHITRSSANQLRGPMMDFLARTIGPDDVMAVMTPETPVSEITFARTLNTLSTEVERYWAWGLLDAPVVPRTPAESEIAACGDPYTGIDGIIRQHRQLALFTSLESLITRLSAMRDERISVLFLSEGWTNAAGGLRIGRIGSLLSSGAAAPRADRQFGGAPIPDARPAVRSSCDAIRLELNNVDYDQRFKQLLRRANAGNVTFYTIDVGGLRTGAPDAAGSAVPSRRHADTLQELAENTDGFASINTNDLGRALARVTDSLSGYYLLGYSSTNPKHDGQYRRITLRVHQPGVEVTGRRGYIAATAGDAVMRRDPHAVAPPAPVPAPIAEAIGRLARLDEDAPLTIGGRPAGDSLEIVAEVSPRELATWPDGLELRVEIADASGARVRTEARLAAGARSVVVTVPHGATSPGPWQVFVDAVNAGSSLGERAQIDLPPATLLGQVRCFRGGPNPRAPMQRAAVMLFQHGERARIEWTAAKPVEQHGVRILDRRGQPLALGAAVSDALGPDARTLRADLNLAALAEGDYVLEATATAGADSDRQLLAFRVTR